MFTRAAIRSFATESLIVVNDVAKQCFFLPLAVNNNQCINSFLEYKLTDKKITLVHTEVPDLFQGHGLGKLLAKHALDYAVENKLDVLLKCKFVGKFYEKNKDDYKSLKVEFGYKD